jgi:hypothetical protein
MSLKTYLNMLTFRRPMGSHTDRAFVREYLEPLPGAYIDLHGNVHVDTDSKSTVLWSAHTDTVHWTEGKQRLHVDYDAMIVGLSKHAKDRGRGNSSCLGADDTTGCYLLREMILAGVSGHYIFHYGEERGGVGSRALAESHPDFLQRFQCAIALDRAGTSDVITRQAGSRTASDAFAVSLASILDMNYAPSAGGIYTDTAEYEALIPECTNLSVGYSGAHSQREEQDLLHLMRLRDRLLAFDARQLVIERDPTAIDADDYSFNRWWDSYSWHADRPIVIKSSDDIYTEDCDLCGAEYAPANPDCYEEDHLCDYCEQVMRGHA